jgi:hypothetical protein
MPFRSMRTKSTEPPTGPDLSNLNKRGGHGDPFSILFTPEVGPHNGAPVGLIAFQLAVALSAVALYPFFALAR